MQIMNNILELLGVNTQWPPFTASMLHSVQGYDGNYNTVLTEVEAHAITFMHEKMAKSVRDVNQLLIKGVKVAGFQGLDKEM